MQMGASSPRRINTYFRFGSRDNKMIGARARCGGTLPLVCVFADAGMEKESSLPSTSIIIIYGGSRPRETNRQSGRRLDKLKLSLLSDDLICSPHLANALPQLAQISSSSTCVLSINLTPFLTEKTEIGVKWKPSV